MFPKKISLFIKMDYTKQVGDVNELKCITSLIELGYECSIPYGDSSRYDFIADINGKLLKFQCKSSRNPINKKGERDESCFCFNCTTSTTNTKKTIIKSYDKNEVDYFITYFNGNCYVVPIDECLTIKTLRFDKPKNNAKHYNAANDFLVKNVFGESLSLIKSRDFFLEMRENQSKSTLERRKMNQNRCVDCGCDITERSLRCEKCSRKHRRKVERPDRDKLKSLIRNNSFLEIGRLYNVSNSSIVKWCKSYKLPYHKTEIKSISDLEWNKI